MPINVQWFELPISMPFSWSEDFIERINMALEFIQMHNCRITFFWKYVKGIWLIDWLIEWLIDWLIGWLTNWLLLIGWIVIRFINRLIGWLVDWFIGWLVYWLIGVLVDWFIGLLVYWLIDW